MAIILATTLICLFLYCGFIIFCSFNWFSLISKNTDASNTTISVSIILPCRNEESTIQTCLQSLLAQDYPTNEIEIIVVDDHSEDATAEIVERFCQKDNRIKLLRLKEEEKFKKAAITNGIQEAKGEIILTTDADCIHPQGWLKAMIYNFEENTGLVSGPVQLQGSNLFEKFQELEFMGLVAVGAASIRAGIPNMCNGANLAYRKSTFLEVGGYSGVDGSPSGDDEFLMHKIAATKKWKLKFALNTKAIVQTPAQRSWKEFREQRIRWISKSAKYKNPLLTIILLISWIGMLSFPITAIYSFVDFSSLFLFFGAFMIKATSEACLLFPASVFFRNTGLLIYLIPEQFFHILYVLWAGIAGNFFSYGWKGRKIR